MLRNAAVSAALTVASVLFSGSALAQAPSLQEQLAAQYKPARMAGAGTVVAEAGTLLAVQKGGIISVPFRAVAKCPARFEDNSLHPSAGFCAGMMRNVSQYFKKGDKVYPLKIDVNLEKAKISFQVVSCDSCNGVDPTTGMKGEVVFEFAKGYLEKASAGQVEDFIGQVFAVTDDQQGSDQGNQQGNQNGGQQQAQGQQGQGQQGQGQTGQDQQADPQTVQLGMSPDEVQGVLGKPDKIFNVGAKQIFVYKDVKVTFMNGKVSDVQ